MAEQAASGYNVWRSYDEPGGIRDELYQIAQSNPQNVQLQVIGHTLQGREIIVPRSPTGRACRMARVLRCSTMPRKVRV